MSAWNCAAGTSTRVEIPDQADTDPREVSRGIVGRNMSAPEVVVPPPIAGDFSHAKPIAIADHKVIRNCVDRVAALPVAMHFLQEIDRSEIAC